MPFWESGHKDRITSMSISGDARWLLSSSMDCSLRVWDIVSATLIGIQYLHKPITSLSISQKNDLLATAHIEENYIRLWANTAVFGSKEDRSDIFFEAADQEEEIDYEVYTYRILLEPLAYNLFIVIF